MKRFAGAAVGLLVTSFAFAAEYHVYYLGGQSNMDGFGRIQELPEAYQGAVDGVWIFHGSHKFDDVPATGVGKWSVLRPGHGTGFTSDGERNNYRPRFGPELTFGRELQALYPERRIALVKYSLGGTALQNGAQNAYGTWAPDYQGTNQYDHALATIANATSVADIDGDGEADTLIPAGIVWMQGEADAQTLDAARAYEANLKRLMDLLRAAWRKDDLPVVIGRITDSGMADDGTVMDYIAIVQGAQRRFVEKDSCAAYSTITEEQSYPPNDAWHYDTEAYIAMGIDFARQLKRLDGQCAQGKARN